LLTSGRKKKKLNRPYERRPSRGGFPSDYSYGGYIMRDVFKPITNNIDRARQACGAICAKYRIKKNGALYILFVQAQTGKRFYKLIYDNINELKPCEVDEVIYDAKSCRTVKNGAIETWVDGGVYDEN
jgi:hypothetical protein